MTIGGKCLILSFMERVRRYFLLEVWMMRRILGFSLALLLLFATSAVAQERLRLATTTSTEHSGLLDVLLPPFEKAKGVKVDVVAVGTGQAIKLGEAGDADVVLVHARTLEDRFVAEGHGVNRRDVMYNDFVVLGPKGDPAGVAGMTDAAAALEKIAAAKATFVSRGDKSGTHVKEQELWQSAGVVPSGGWYLESGRGMGEVITMAGQRQGYALSDRGTWLAHKDKADLRILVEGDERLFNPYGVIAVNPQKHRHVKYDLAMALIEFMTSDEGRKIIADFTVGGEQLFFVYPEKN